LILDTIWSCGLVRRSNRYRYTIAGIRDELQYDFRICSFGAPFSIINDLAYIQADGRTVSIIKIDTYARVVRLRFRRSANRFGFIFLRFPHFILRRYSNPYFVIRPKAQKIKYEI